MVGLDTLTEDVLLVIASKLDREGTLCLRLVCHNISNIVAPYALSHLAINIHGDNYYREMEKLDAYVRRKTPGAYYVRSLAILCLANTESMGRLDGQEAVEMLTQREERLRQLILSAFEQLDIRNLLWKTHRGDPPWASEVIATGIAAHPLRELTLDFAGGCPQTSVALRGIGGLWKLSVKNTVYLDFTGIGFRDYMFSEIAHVIAASPSLHDLAIDVGYPSVDTFRSPGLHLFLPNITDQQIAPLPLRSLSLNSVNMEFIGHILPHLRSLESLSTIPCIPESHIPLPHAWYALQKEGIRLRRIRITTNDIKRELLDYLLFCKDSLIELIFEASDQENWLQEMFDVANQNSPHILYTEVLPILAPRLEVLEIRANRGNKWCFNSMNAIHVGMCTQLKELVIAIVEYDQLHNVYLKNIVEQMKAKMHPDLHLKVLNVHRVLQIA